MKLTRSQAARAWAAAHDGEGAAGAGAEGEVGVHAGGLHQADDVVANLLVHEDLAHLPLGVDERLRVHHLLDLFDGVIQLQAQEHLALRVGGRVADGDAHEEAI